MDIVYLDNAATTPVHPAALTAAWPFLTNEFGNASSTHELGEHAAAALADARTRVARFLGARSGDIVFTSGGTEGDNFAIVGLALANPRGKHIVSAPTEHEAVLAALDYLERVHRFEVSWLPVGRDASLNPADLDAVLRDDTTLVTLMMANNEVGTLHPVRQLAELAHARGALFHTDAVQALGWLPLDVRELGVDALTLSGHKIGAPKGSGAVFVRSGLAIEPLLHGGGQEANRRSGTENVAWAVALATAIEQLPASATEGPRVASLRDAFIAEVLRDIPSAHLTGSRDERLASIASFTLAGVGGEAILLELERRGVIVSSGSACAAGRDDPSHVLMACGYSEDEARTSVRFSLAHSTTADDLSRAARALRDSVAAVSGIVGERTT
jgi:cysteine desulfurase